MSLRAPFAKQSLAYGGDCFIVRIGVLTYRYTDLIRQNYRADLAHRHVSAISQFHRIQASPGFRAAAEYVAAQLASEGVEVTIRRYPADGKTSFWSTPGFLEWECDSATLQMLDEDGQPSETFCDFAAIPTSLIQRSIPVEGEFEVVVPDGEGGSDPADYTAIDVTGRLVLTAKPVTQVQELAVRQHGAAGILFDGMGLGGRTDLDLPDARQYTSFWWPGMTQPDGWGFVLSPRQGRRLRTGLAEGKPVRVRAAISSRFYAGSFEVVDAWIPGSDSTGEEVLLVSHLCHPQPGAHDNGSGAGALIETAATLARLIAEGRLPPPRRGIRFLWPPEMTGTYAWCAEHEDELKQGRWIAGLNLDMVGADQCQTGSTLQFVSLPQAGASYADHLLASLREPFLERQRYEDTPFGAGSDHCILSDPTVGVPTPMLIQWPDRFYHTSADTPDRVSPATLGRAGGLAAVYAYWLAAAGHEDACWLGHWMVTRFSFQAGRDAAAVTEKLRAATTEAERERTWAEAVQSGSFRTERMLLALDTLQRLDRNLSDEVAGLRTMVLEAAGDQDRWARSFVGSLQESPAIRPEEAWRLEAQRVVPQRRWPGPIDVAMVLQARARELLPTYWEMVKQGGKSFDDLTSLMQYWADGRRSVAEISDLVAAEAGRPPNDLPLRYFKLLAQTGTVDLSESS
jgi:hypothetical protein